MQSELSWRIPTTGDPRLLRIGLAQVGLASIVAALILIVAAPREWMVPALVGLIPLDIFMAYRRWRAFHRSGGGANNVWIDDAGLHWVDAAGHERTFVREDVTSFSIGHDQETVRGVPSLTLQMSSGFESQPIELYEPATPQNVRALLTSHWNLVEFQRGAEAEAAAYDVAVCVYGECHDDFQEWHWEGTKEELARFFGLLAAAAEELPPPPPGARPMQRTVITTRRQTARLRVAHASDCHFEPDMLAAPAGVLREIAVRASETLAAAKEPGDVKFELTLGPKDRWTFQLHLREP